MFGREKNAKLQEAQSQIEELKKRVRELEGQLADSRQWSG